MARNFKVLKPEYKDWLFVDKYAEIPHQYISYRHVIEHALFKLLFEEGDSVEDCKNIFLKFKQAFDGKQIYPNEEKWHMPLKLYWFRDTNNFAVLVDNTKYCFPLVFDSARRVIGLTEAVLNINNKIYEILGVLNSYVLNQKNWDKELQEKLDEFDSREINQKAA
jgi:hypothetical protein